MVNLWVLVGGVVLVMCPDLQTWVDNPLFLMGVAVKRRLERSSQTFLSLVIDSSFSWGIAICSQANCEMSTFPSGPGTALGSPFSRKCLIQLQHLLGQPQLAPLYQQEQWLYSKALLGLQETCLITESTVNPATSPEPHFCHLYCSVTTQSLRPYCRSGLVHRLTSKQSFWSEN